MLALQPRDKYRYIFYNIKIRNIFLGASYCDCRLEAHLSLIGVSPFLYLLSILTSNSSKV